MYSIDNILLDESILSTNFTCDLERCKGACCTFAGEFGAPLLDEEIPEMEKVLDVAIGYLSERSRQYLKDHGFFEGFSGSYSTKCIDKKDCVFVYYERDVAKCAIEKAYFDGKIHFRKPLSCHLFPIRVGDFGGKYLYYEVIKECKPAIEKGNFESTPMHEAVKESIIRLLGEDWYNNLLKFKKEIGSNL